MKLLTSVQIEALLAEWLAKTNLSNSWQSAMVAVVVAITYYLANGQVISLQGVAAAIVAGVFSHLTTSANKIIAKKEGKVEGKIEVVQELIDGDSIIKEATIDDMGSKEPQPYHPIAVWHDKKTEKLDKSEIDVNIKT